MYEVQVHRIQGLNILSLVTKLKRYKKKNEQPRKINKL